MVVAVFGDAHGHAEALDAVIGAAEACDAQELWSLGDMIGARSGPRACGDPHARALRGGADGQPRLRRDGIGRAHPVRRAGLAGRAVDRARPRPARAAPTSSGCVRASPRRAAARCSSGTAARATPCTSTSAHPTRQPASRSSAPSSGWSATPTSRPRGGRHHAAPKRSSSGSATPLDLAGGKWLLNPGAVGAPAPSRSGWWNALDLQAADGAYWLLLDLERRTATWRRAPYDPAPARLRARALGLDDLTTRLVD